VANNLPAASDKKIIVAGQQFPSNIYPWMRYCRESGCKLHIVDPPDDPDSRGKTWNQRILEAIDTDTLLVALGNVHWTDGTLFDLEKIGERAREVDALFVIDGTQSIGALPFNQQKVQADAVICAGYKWLMGPYSIALGYFGERFLDGIPLEEGWLERKDSENFAGLVNYADTYQPGAVRFDVGESSNFILVPMMIRALRQLLEWDPAEIQAYCQSLTADLVEELQAHQFNVEDPGWRAHHLFGIYLPEQIRPQKLQQKLTEQNIHVSVRGSAIRISPNVYNDEIDIEALQKVLISAL
jgi:selenocysteine lyase/cysteine desulfurase